MLQVLHPRQKVHRLLTMEEHGSVGGIKHWTWTELLRGCFDLVIFLFFFPQGGF